jgi:hypothetical protein
MYRHNNSASRIHSFLLKLSSPSLPVQNPTYLVFASAFGISEEADDRKAIAVLAHLHGFHRELSRLENQLVAANVSSSLYLSAFSRIRHVVSPLTLTGSWQGYMPHLAPEVLLAIQFCNEMLPDEESEISLEELKGIADEVNSLETLLENSQISETLRELIEHHIALIRDALLQYQISGAKVFREAARTALGEIIEKRDEIELAKEDGEVKGLDKLWKRVNTATDSALKAEKLALLFEKISNFLPPL